MNEMDMMDMMEETNSLGSAGFEWALAEVAEACCAGEVLDERRVCLLDTFRASIQMG